jgi:hypothetical protein
MTIRSVDMQVLIPKVPDVARLQNEQQQTHLSRQNEFAEQMQAQSARMAQTVAQTNKDEDVHIQEKQEREKKRKKNKQSEEQEEQDNNNETRKPPGGVILVPKEHHKLDIKI